MWPKELPYRWKKLKENTKQKLRQRILWGRRKLWVKRSKKNKKPNRCQNNVNQNNVKNYYIKSVLMAKE